MFTVPPHDVPRVQSFGSYGASFRATGSPRGDYVEPADSHDARRSVKNEFTGWSVRIDGSPVPQYEPVEQTGYLDPSAESFKHFVVGLRRALDTTGADR